MRKILPILCIILLLSVLVACDNADNLPTDTDNNTTNQQTDNPITDNTPTTDDTPSTDDTPTTDDTPSTDDTPTVCAHSFGEWVTVSTATCEKEGIKERSCSKCDTKQTNTISKLEHTIVTDSAIEATCQESGKTEGRHCSVCNAVLVKQETTNILEHNYSNGICSYCKAPKPSENLEIGIIDEFGTQVAHVYGLGMCTDENIVIPSTYQGAPVTWIWATAFENCMSITSVYIPDTVEQIGGGAFKGCKFLREIRLPSNLIAIENNLFNGCISLVEIDIPKNVQYIEGAAFVECTSLTSIVLPDTVQYIGNGAFRKCSSLNNISMQNGIETIENYAFCKCISLEEIILPETVKTLGNGVFEECSKLKSIILPSNLTYLPDFVFAYTNFTTYSVSAKMLFIGKCAFLSCSSLETIYISSNIKLIEEKAFMDCKKLVTIYYDGTIDEWKAILKGEGWDMYMETYTIICSNGTITK